MSNNMTADLAQDAMGATILQHRPALQDKEKLARLATQYSSALESCIRRKDIKLAEQVFGRLAGVISALGFFGGWSALKGTINLYESIREDPRAGYLPGDVEINVPENGARQAAAEEMRRLEDDEMPQGSKPDSASRSHADLVAESIKAAQAAGLPIPKLPTTVNADSGNPMAALLKQPELQAAPEPVGQVVQSSPEPTIEEMAAAAAAGSGGKKK